MNLRKAYNMQKAMAKRRGVPWEFTYPMFELKWVLSGKLHLRGRYRYVMGRINDEGPYSFYNTIIITHSENVATRKNKDNGDQVTWKLKPCSVDGVTYDSRASAGKAHGVDPATIKYWIDKGKHNAYYL